MRWFISILQCMIFLTYDYPLFLTYDYECMALNVFATFQPISAILMDIQVFPLGL